MSNENLDPQAATTLAKAEQNIAATILNESQRLLADSKAGRLVKAHPADLTMADDTPPDGGPENEVPEMDTNGSPSSETPLSDEEDAPVDHADLVEAFRAMDPEQLAAYKAAIAEVEGDAGGDEPPMDTATPDEDEAAPEPDFGKSERAMLKSELATMKVEIEKLQKSLAKPQPVPARRVNLRSTTGATRPAPAAQPKTLTKAEAKLKLAQVAKHRGTSLKKSDRRLILDFDAGSASIADVAHLLKDNS